MYPAELTLKRMIQRTLYMLKRQYGGTIDVYTLVSATTNPKTGVVTSSRTVVHIDRAIILPAKISKEVRKSISQISANKAFVTGGSYDAGRRLFVIDHDDAPSLTITNNSYIVYRSRKYEIETVKELEFEAGWAITGRELIGEVPEQIYYLKTDNLLVLEGGTNVS